MYTTDESGTVRLILRPQKDQITVIIHIVLWLSALLSGTVSYIDRSLSSLILSILLIVASLGYALYMQTKQIAVSDFGIEMQCFGIFHRKVKWKQIRTYRLVHKAGSHCSRPKDIHFGEYVEERYTIRLDCGGIFSIRVSNRYTNYHQFKQILKEKKIKRLDTVQK